MDGNRKYSTELADIIMRNFSVAQMRRDVYFDKMPRLIFRLKKTGQELGDYKKIDEALRKFKGNLEWGVFQCPRSKVNYMISPLKWEEIERGKDFKGEDHLKGDIHKRNSRRHLKKSSGLSMSTFLIPGRGISLGSRWRLFLIVIS